jgi:hypothetical protein
MARIIITTSFRSVGCTFLDWSVLYLSGQQQYFSLKENCAMPICHDPLNTRLKNAHGHRKNCASGSVETDIAIKKLRNCHDHIATLYPYPLRSSSCLSKLGKSIHSVRSIDQRLHEQTALLQIEDYKKMVNTCLDQDLSVLFVEADARTIGYHWHLRSLDQGYLRQSPLESEQEARQEQDDLFFADSQATWKALGLSEIWDQRERMALDMRPYDTLLFPKIAFDRPYWHINCQDLWHCTSDVVRECFKWLQLPIDSARWAQWHNVSQRWQQMQQDILRFEQNLPHILDAIVNNWYLELGQMTLKQEATIQHCLIYQHNLNLKTWQLEHFPDNTQKLHKLLEPNQHLVPPIY